MNNNKPAKVQRIKQQIDALNNELHGMVQLSTELKSTINSAKTLTKKQHFRNKLKKNNLKLMSLLTTLNHWNNLYESLLANAEVGEEVD